VEKGGNVVFTYAPDFTGEIAITNSGSLVFPSTGIVLFNNAEGTVEGVTFDGGLALKGTAKVGVGDISLPVGSAIRFDDETAILGILTGQSIKVGDVPVLTGLGIVDKIGVSDVVVTLSTASYSGTKGKPTLSATAANTLELGAVSQDAPAEFSLDSQKDSSAAYSAFYGALQVAPGAILSIRGGSSTNMTTLKTSGDMDPPPGGAGLNEVKNGGVLEIADGGAISLPNKNAVIDLAGNGDSSGVVINGNADAVIRAKDGIVTLTGGLIQGPQYGAVPSLALEGGAVSIKVTNIGNNEHLFLSKVNLDISAFGSVDLTYGSGKPTIVLNNKAQLTVTTGETYENPLGTIKAKNGNLGIDKTGGGGTFLGAPPTVTTPNVVYKSLALRSILVNDIGAVTLNTPSVAGTYIINNTALFVEP
jgi:hypothetical protein